VKAFITNESLIDKLPIYFIIVLNYWYKITYMRQVLQYTPKIHMLLAPRFTKKSTKIIAARRGYQQNVPNMVIINDLKLQYVLCKLVYMP